MVSCFLLLSSEQVVPEQDDKYRPELPLDFTEKNLRLTKICFLHKQSDNLKKADKIVTNFIE
jgi:hypothetical protein